MSSARLLYLVTEDWYFVLHRLPMARAARDAGFEVHVAARVAKHGEAIAAEGFQLHPLDWRRASMNPVEFLRSIQAVRSLYRAVRPDLVHHVALQPGIVGSIAALGLPIAVLNATAGVGFAFTSNTLKARIARPLLAFMMRALFNRRRSMVVVENPDDGAALAALGVAAERIVRIPGSGVDVERFMPLPEPDGPITVAYAGRLLEDKGLRALIDAQARLAETAHPIRLLLAGEPDPANPTSISASTLDEWRRRPGVELLGHVADVRTVWAAAHIAVLPSRREGLPLSLVEAAACGRPLVATDVPGCREIARADVDAMLVPVDDPPALADAIRQLADDPQRRARYGAAGRRLAETEFSSARVGHEIVALYHRLLGQPNPATPSDRNTGPSEAPTA
ncbi:MAG: glycosyltransferase [Rhizobiales bacterium]|nr:glycosyltransferase [Hyphomicrobiales bacterium]